MSQKNYMTHEDKELLDLIITAQVGWRDMLSVLLQRHHNALLTRCYFYLKNREDAEDATQETELRVFRAIKGFRGEASFRTWLFAIAGRQCYDLIRRRARQMLDEHLRALIEIHEMNVNRAPDDSDEHSAVNHVLTQLPVSERDVLILRYHMDLSLKDMSSTLGIGLSATKMRLYRALEKYAALLENERYSMSH